MSKKLNRILLHILSYDYEKTVEPNSTEIDMLSRIEAIDVITDRSFSGSVGYYWYIGKKEYDYLISEHIFKYLTNLQSLRLHYIITDEIVFQRLHLPQTFHVFHPYDSFEKIDRLPEEIGELKELVTLDLGHTNIHEIPYTIAGLCNLKYLFLNDTPIKEIPSWIGSLKNLESLNLKSLQLRSLPKEIMNLGLPFKEYYNYEEWEKGIFIRNLSLATQPVSLFYQSKQLVQNYYDTRKELLKEAKVIFMGDGGAGKSYTIQRIINGGENLEKDTELTHDIAIEHWDNQEQIVDYYGSIDFWDFGGQDIYLSMHRCFLTERSCYVIVLSNRQYGSQRGLMRQARYWLKNISPYAKSSPILIAINTWRGQPRDGISLSQLQSEFPELIIVDQIVYDAHDPEKDNFRRLISCICRMAQENYSYDLEFPISWSSIRDRLIYEYKSVNRISEKEYFHICEEEMTAHDGYYDKAIAQWLLSWFNDLGYCFNYDDTDGGHEKDDYQVLKPKWVIAAMYKIINYKIDRDSDDLALTTDELSHELLYSWQLSEGRIEKNRVVKLLVKNQESKGNYSQTDAEYIIRVLIKHKIVYLFIEEEKKEMLFIPALCSDIKPCDFDTIDTKAELELKTEYLIRFNYLPETVMQLLMIRCYQEQKKLTKVWKYGFHLKGDYEYIIVEMRDDSELLIKYYESEEYSGCYGLHVMRNWLSDIYKNLGIENVRDFIIKRNSLMHQTAFISVTALINAYISNPTMELFYTQDDDIYQGYQINDLLSVLCGSDYKTKLPNEYSCQSGNHSDIIRISFQYYPDAEAAGTGTD